MNIMRSLVCYSNPVITAITAIFFLIFSGPNVDRISTAAENNEAISFIYALSAAVFGLLAVWVFSIGALVVLVQFIYGLVKYFSVEENKVVYLHYFYGFMISLSSYFVILYQSLSFNG